MARKPYQPIQPDKEACKPGNGGGCPPSPTGKVPVSTDPGNSISLRPDGIYAPAVIYRENTVVEAANDAVRVDEGQTSEGFRKFEVGVKISMADGNVLEVREDGLYISDPEQSIQEQPYLYQGSLATDPLVPAAGRIIYTEKRSLIRVTSGIKNLVLGTQPFSTDLEELYLVQDGQRSSPLTLYWEEGVQVDNVAGPASRSFAPGGSIHMVRHRDNQWLVLAGTGANEAPFDGQPYVRKDGVWVQQHSQVTPALIVGESQDAMALEVSPIHFNRIVDIHPSFTDLLLKRQYLVDFQEDFEATFTRQGSFLLTAPMGVTINGFPGPIGFRIESKPKGCVLKKISSDNWLLLGSVQQDGSVEPLPPITTMEFPGSGAFKGIARLMEGSRLFDMTGNANMISSVHAQKNMVIAAVAFDAMEHELDQKDHTFLSSYKHGLTGNLSPLDDGDIVSIRDLINLLLLGGFEDVAVMISDILGEGDHTAFTGMMNQWVASRETPLVSSFYGAAVSIADPVGVSNALKIADWIQDIEVNYPTIRSILRASDYDFMVYGVNSRSVSVTNRDPYRNQLRVDTSQINDLTNNSFPFWGLVQKLEMPAEIPVYLSMQDFASETARHWAYTSAMMALEDEYPFLSGNYTDFDADFTNVSLLIGNTDALIDRSNIENEVNNSPQGVTKVSRPDKGWKFSRTLNGTNGYISVYDNPSLRLGNGNFTIELIFRGNGNKTNMIFFAKDGVDIEDRSYMLRFIGNFLTFNYTLVGDADARMWSHEFTSDEKVLLLQGARRHLTVQRRDDAIRFFINGRQFGTTLDLPTGAAFQDCAMPLNIGANGNPLWSPPATAGYFGQFHVDNFRVTKGLARYPNTGFTVRTTPFKTGSGA